MIPGAHEGCPANTDTTPVIFAHLAGITVRCSRLFLIAVVPASGAVRFTAITARLNIVRRAHHRRRLTMPAMSNPRAAYVIVMAALGALALGGCTGG